MESHFLPADEIEPFVERLMAGCPVVGPVATKTKFAYQRLRRASELRLDHDVTILPPKKVFFPQEQALVSFGPDGMKSSIAPQRQILLGVHPYDLRAIDMLDKLFFEGHEDRNYLANREAVTVIGANVQTVSPRAFFGSIHGPPPTGHDGFLTQVEGGYLFQVLTPRGEELLSAGAFVAASKAQTAEAAQANERARDDCKEVVHHSAAEVARRLRRHFSTDKLWAELSEACFSCGSCNMVCPTCYCFDVQDTWNLDQKSGVRSRTWDGCQLEDFAKVSLGAGATENFRETRATRYRHRLLRKMAYLNDSLGGPACVGCGRCSSACVPDIADPVAAIKRIMQEG
jgi:sulfhydrogenase subunit beta (sulfur reductase)